jgi:hypothetical protein
VLIETFAAPRKDLERDDREEVTQGFIEMLPFLGCIAQAQSDALIAIHYLDYSYEMASFTLDADIGTVKSRVNRGLESIRQMMNTQVILKFDLTVWATATKGVPKNHPYFSIAEAYEEIYMFLVKNSKNPSAIGKSHEHEEQDVDSLMRQIQKSGALDEGFDDLDYLMRE